MAAAPLEANPVNDVAAIRAQFAEMALKYPGIAPILDALTEQRPQVDVREELAPPPIAARSRAHDGILRLVERCKSIANAKLDPGSIGALAPNTQFESLFRRETLKAYQSPVLAIWTLTKWCLLEGGNALISRWRADPKLNPAEIDVLDVATTPLQQIPGIKEIRDTTEFHDRCDRATGYVYEAFQAVTRGWASACGNTSQAAQMMPVELLVGRLLDGATTGVQVTSNILRARYDHEKVGPEQAPAAYAADRVPLAALSCLHIAALPILDRHMERPSDEARWQHLAEIGCLMKVHHSHVRLIDGELRTTSNIPVFSHAGEFHCKHAVHQVWNPTRMKFETTPQAPADLLDIDVTDFPWDQLDAHIQLAPFVGHCPAHRAGVVMELHTLMGRMVA